MKSILSVFNRSPKNEDYMKRITPEWITSLKENEIFVFGCRNSGRHFDGASCFALEHFGAIMGQREGRQGQSYAIPTIGGTIDKKELQESVARFTEYAAEHPELTFLSLLWDVVEAVGGLGWLPRCSEMHQNLKMYICHWSFGMNFKKVSLCI